MNHSTPGLPVHHQLPESTQTHVHRVSDAIQPSHPLSSPSSTAFNLSQHQGLFKWVSSSHQVAKLLEFQFQHQSFWWIFRTDSFRRDVCFLHSINSVYVSIPTSQFLPPNPSPPWYPYTYSLHLCLFLCFANKLIYTIFNRVHRGVNPSAGRNVGLWPPRACSHVISTCPFALSSLWLPAFLTACRAWDQDSTWADDMWETVVPIHRGCDLKGL